MKAEQIKTSFGRLIRADKFLRILVVTAGLAASASINASGVYAQKSKPSKPVAKKNPVKKNNIRTETIRPLNNICIPPESDYVSTIQIDKSSAITMTVQTANDSKVLVNAEPISSLDKVLAGIDKKSVMTVKADPALDFGLIAKTLSDIRRITKSCANIEASTEAGNQYIYFPPEPMPDNMNVRPNPLTLIVKLNQDKKIMLNSEDEGSLDNTSTLISKLKEVFKYREEIGVFREGTNEVEKTVFIKAAPTVKFGEVIKIANAVKAAGASPVGLQIDNINN